ncbi:putative P1/s1 nuclease3'-nucleotidase/nuclease [Leptomonas pyrrhocoris]|uniref:Putative P1/s1 nuclease3'-nucleotidase/nuclease n=1 Tax=Leptomonas pyrrhocoris TaxID=157538 RepID=A0A0M9G659_LEPPY|nr:putative P1/s1 nuclease3'-nucleotidase/nuclease [Leptomonas pyrrhocoris]KPA83167.1 putative P1/s1 nuclease3'-nucleotidase/nuclease [Leptomonas pyrrhocoris]|eukprot:XP_015661606.1 putative P1/s1 nuclease3'-nucleotidase/nuclease [Leptomonas pyrrhocoris]
MVAHNRTLLAVLATVALTAAFQAVEVCGWGCVGHMLVAEIARRRLDEANAQKMNAMAHNFHESGPFPWSPDVVQAACWADDAKQWHQYAMRSWHFIDTPYNPENITIDVPLEAVNAVTVSANMITALKNVKAPLYMLNFAWVNLVHFIGDLHQPLHAAAMYSHKFPHGDRGGNAIEVKVKGAAVKLHALWDDICDVPAPHYRRPLSDTDTFALAATADRLEDTYKFPSSLRTLPDPQVMADESHEFAVNSSYDGVVPGAELGTEYMRRCKEVAEGRITLAGYRLGYLLNELLKNINVGEMAMSAYRKHARCDANKQLARPIGSQFRFREVLTVERKVYEHEDEEGDGTVLSREETVREVRGNRDRKDGDVTWQTDL